MEVDSASAGHPLSPKRQGGLEKGRDERVRGARRRCELGLKERRDEEPMIGKLYDARLVTLTSADDAKPAGLEDHLEGWIELVAAVEALLDLLPSVDTVGPRAQSDRDRDSP